MGRFSKLSLIFVAFSGLLFLSGASVPADETTNDDEALAPCADTQFITCFLPFVAFVYSDEAKDFTPARANGQITQTQLTRLCE
jgi:hypothetical protein